MMKATAIKSISLAVLMGAALLPASAQAKEGTAKYTTYWVVSSYSPVKLDADGFAIMDYSGVTSSGDPMFDHLAVHCLASSAIKGTVDLNNGACIGLAPDGGQLFITYDLKADEKGRKGSNVFVSGTGSFKGISGGGSINSTFLNGPDGKAMFVSEHEVKWKLP